MIKIGFFFICLLLLTLNGQTFASSAKDPAYLEARKNGAEAYLVVEDTDDDSNPVHGVLVRVHMGMNFADKGNHLEGVTNADGRFVVKGKTTGNVIEIAASKSGWYRSYTKLCFAKMGAEHEVKDGKWQPWGMKLPLRMRLVKSPLKLIEEDTYREFPATDRWIGYDLIARDWVSSGCRGMRSDFEVRLTWDGLEGYHSKKLQVECRFQGVADGFYPEHYVKDSSFSLAYRADVERRYERTLSRRRLREGRDFCVKGTAPDCFFVFRSRSELSDDGRITANYGVLQNFFAVADSDGTCHLRLRYYYNPTPNDTNLEPAR